MSMGERADIQLQDNQTRRQPDNQESAENPALREFAANLTLEKVPTKPFQDASIPDGFPRDFDPHHFGQLAFASNMGVVEARLTEKPQPNVSDAKDQNVKTVTVAGEKVQCLKDNEIPDDCKKSGIAVKDTISRTYKEGEIKIGFNEKGEQVLIKGNNLYVKLTKQDRERLNVPESNLNGQDHWFMKDDKYGYRSMPYENKDYGLDLKTGEFNTKYSADHTAHYRGEGQHYDKYKRVYGGAEVQVGGDGLVEKITRHDGSIIAPAFKTNQDGSRYIAALNVITANNISYAYVASGRQGKDFALSQADAAKSPQPDIKEYKNIDLAVNANFSYQTENSKPGEMVIVRGDGTVLNHVRSNDNEHLAQQLSYPEFKFDQEGRIALITPPEELLNTGQARKRVFEWKDGTNELAGTQVQFRSQAGFLTAYNHVGTGEDKNWYSWNPAAGWTPALQGTRSLSSEGVWTSPDLNAEGQIDTLTAKPGEAQKFQASKSNDSRGYSNNRPVPTDREKEAASERDRAREKEKEAASERNRAREKAEEAAKERDRAKEEDKEVSEQAKPTLIYIGTKWCPNCPPVHNRVAELAENPNLEVRMYDGDQRPDIVQQYGITGYPSVILFDGQNNQVGRILHHVPEATIEQLLEK